VGRRKGKRRGGFCQVEGVGKEKEKEKKKKKSTLFKKRK
jgi:hypothetical protein